MTRADRISLATRRIINILRAQGVATLRTLEQKISDAGPPRQRVDPHILSEALRALRAEGLVLGHLGQHDVPWFYLRATPPPVISSRLAELEPIHTATLDGNFKFRVGQTLEIAAFRALSETCPLHWLGHFRDLDLHHDSKRYSKLEPPTSFSGRSIPGNKPLDFLVIHPSAGAAGIEVKNIREWLYPDRDEIRALLFKCCHLDAVPVLIARRTHYSTFSVLNRCGFIIHQNYNQLYPVADRALAIQASAKNLLGYHDIRVGNAPDGRLLKFIGVNLPAILPEARARFDAAKHVLLPYAAQQISYTDMKAALSIEDAEEPEL